MKLNVIMECLYPDAREIYIKMNQYCKEKDVWITRAGDIYEWHSLRNRNAFSSGHDLSTKTYTIVPEPADCDHFFTLYLPDHSDCSIQSGNADIIKRDGDRVYIKTHNLQDNNEIILGIT
jgi:hypothetical protein